nr:T9SS type A sorting domain-containing protein [Chitinophagales bacterium]
PLEWESGSSYIYVVVDEDDIVSEISESNNTDCELVNISSLLNSELGSSLNIYPNPASDLLNVSATGQILLQDVTIVNNLSQAVALLNPTDEFSLQSVSIDISRIPSGIYWAVIVTNQGVYKEPIIVE